MDILEYSALDLGQRIRAGEISPMEAGPCGGGRRKTG